MGSIATLFNRPSTTGKGRGQAQQFASTGGAIQQQFAQQTGGISEEFFKQLLSALQFGGTPQQQIPFAAKGVEGALQARDDAFRFAQDELSRGGLQGTPFGAQILTNLFLQGGLAAKEAELGPAAALFGLAPQLAFNSPGIQGGLLGISGQNAVQANQAFTASQNAQTSRGLAALSPLNALLEGGLSF